MEIRPIESQAPDVVVVVGDGTNRREFPCYRLLLSFASPHLDQLLCSTTNAAANRIELKDKDPEEWKLFYSFVDPSTLRKARITPENVEVLVRWFHGFGMTGLLAECDAVLASKLSSQEDNKKDGNMEKLVPMGDIAVVRNLNQTKKVVQELLVPLLKDPSTRAKVVSLLQRNHEFLQKEMEKLLPQVFNNDEMFAASDHSIGSKNDGDNDNNNNSTTAETTRIVPQTAEFALDEDKFEQLVKFLRTTKTQGRTLVFADSTLACDHIAQDLSQAGWPAYSLHKGLKKKQSKAAFESFKAGGTMVVNDFTVSKLNVEIPPSAMVISYDMPSTLEDYKKRLERVGQEGAAHSFLGQWDSELLNPLRSFLSQQNQQVPSWLQEMADFHSKK